MIHKTINYRRMQRERHIRRKEKILVMSRPDNMPAQYDARDIWAESHDAKAQVIVEGLNKSYPAARMYGFCVPYFNARARGQLSKGKIHCSCPMCSFQGRTMQERRQAESMLDILKDEDLLDGQTKARLVRMANNSKFD